MTNKQLLAKQEKKLAMHSYNLEKRQEYLRFLVEIGLPYDSDRMLCALDDYTMAQYGFEQVEKDYLLLKAKIAAAQQE